MILKSQQQTQLTLHRTNSLMKLKTQTKLTPYQIKMSLNH